VVPELTNAEILELVTDPRYRDTGDGLLITGGSQDERSTRANTVLRRHAEAGRSCLCLKPFDVVAAYHFGQDRLKWNKDVLLLHGRSVRRPPSVR
jgi:hypothetical protein